MIEAFVKHLVLRFQVPGLECPCDHDLKLLDVDRLRHEVVSTPFHGFNRRLDIPIGRHHDTDRAVGFRKSLVDDLHSRFPGHAEVGQHHIKRLGVEQVKCFVGIACEEYLVGIFQHGLKPFTGVLLVIDYQ
ncbi:MAG: hypothetical protein BWY82_02339 [Verrucomicrobia bacterium ADurb.Bin474]|nr:MAG: hypothetical protein BWY82_02339 [Verrucomicrobia bacterium ADurb.Bin474]